MGTGFFKKNFSSFIGSLIVALLTSLLAFYGQLHNFMGETSSDIGNLKDSLDKLDGRIQFLERKSMVEYKNLDTKINIQVLAKASLENNIPDKQFEEVLDILKKESPLMAKNLLSDKAMFSHQQLTAIFPSQSLR